MRRNLVCILICVVVTCLLLGCDLIGWRSADEEVASPSTAAVPTTAAAMPTPTSASEPAAAPGGDIIVDHNCTDVSLIPGQWLEQAKDGIVWAYGSTSHGTQLWVGADYLSGYVDSPSYSFCYDWRTAQPRATRRV